jgi:diacylglycerol kinase family enzyme
MSGRIPAIVNVASGSAAAAREALVASGAFDLYEVQPSEIAPTVKKLVTGGARRILVAGGDGTIRAAAEQLLETPAELALLPGGTLNHFAKDLGISTVSAEAVELALGEACRAVDVGVVNGRIFLNTSSVGVYVRYVRVREELEKTIGYRLASMLAAFRILFTFRLMAVEVEAEGQKRIFRTPLVFIGVGERELQLPMLGQRVPGGEPGLHVMVVQGRSRARLFAMALSAVARGVKSVAHTPQFESFIVNHFRIAMSSMGKVAVDGEIMNLDPPLEYQLRREALTVVCPPAGIALARAR